MSDVQLKRYPLRQIVKTPTHGNHILDCIYTNLQQSYSKPTNHPGLGLCHHSVVCLTPLNVKPNTNSVTFSRRLNSLSAKTFLVNELKTINWSTLFNLPTCELQWTYFYDRITTLLDTHLPYRKITKYETDKPWITEDFKTLIQKRQFALKCGNMIQFKMYRNKVNKACKTLRAQHYNKNINGLQKTNPRMWWRKTQSILGKNSCSNSMAGLSAELCDGDIQALTEEINSFFHSVSCNLPSLQPPVSKETVVVPDKFILTVEEVEKALLKSDTSKATGPNDIPTWILHDLAGLISKPVCCIFNTSIREGSLPTDWKKADVVPIPKLNPPKSIQSDLRPISLTSILSKHLESFIGNWILEAIAQKMDVYQYGGLKGLSTTHALIDMIHHWHTMIHKRDTVRIMFIDYSKAFDTVNHNTLIDKFRKLDIHPLLLRWLQSFLYQRQQRVKIGEDVSAWLTLKGAVPQGSWLAPLCFIVYISDITVDGRIKMHKYIDDITLTEHITSAPNSQMQHNLDTILDWSTVHSMKINEKKTKEMVLTFKQDKLPLPPLICNNSTIERVDVFKILGVWFSNDMKWKHHVQYMYSRASPRLYYLRQLRRCGVADKDLIIFYKSIIQPVLEYACPAWHTGLTQQDSNLLEQIQKRAMYTIYPDIPYKDAIKLAGLGTLSSRRESLCKTFFNNICNKNHKLNYLLKKRQEIPYNLRHTQPYDTDTPLTERYMNSPIMYGLLNFT